MPAFYRFQLRADDALTSSSRWTPVTRETAGALCAARPVVVVSAAGTASWFDDESPYFDARSSTPLTALRYYLYAETPPALPPIPAMARTKLDDAPTGAVASVEHWVELIFEYTDREPVTGEEYVLIKPDGSKEKGTLGSDGTISKKGVAEGTYTVVLKRVERVAWDDHRVAAGEEAVLGARTSGLPDGTKARVRIFRELAETDDDVIDELDATVAADRVEARWKYDVTASDERKKEMGSARFIAELSVENGKRWAKTLAPLVVDLPTIERIEWSADRIGFGETVEMQIDATGIPSGTTVTFTVFRHALDSSDEKIGEATATLEGGNASARFRYANDGAADIVKDASGEYFFVAKIASPVERIDRSGYLWCTQAALDDEEAA